MADSNFKVESPLGVTVDENAAKGFIRIVVVIPELRTKWGIRGRRPANATVKVDFQPSSLQLQCLLKVGNRCVEYKVAALEHPILPESSTWECADKKIIIRLQKKDRNDCWNLQRGLNAGDQ